MKNNKRGISGIVTTVLLILVAITAVALIAAFLIPFIKGTLDEGQDCFEVLGKLEIVKGQNTFYDIGPPEIYSVMIKRGYTSDAIELEGLSIALIDSVGDSAVTTLTLTNGDTVPANGESKSYSTGLNLPTAGNPIVSVEVAPILSSGQTCDAVSVSF